MDAEALYVEHLPLINRIAESLCRRNGIRGADAEDFAAEVRLKLLQDDYAVFRKFRGASSLPTFLMVVISNHFRDYRIRLWGKWRPSAEAKRQGDVAVLLEAAVYRDGLSFEKACAVLEQSGHAGVDRVELRKILRRLPYRAPRRVEGEATLADLTAPDEADGRVMAEERRTERRAAEAALQRALARLDPEDQLLIRMRFFEGMSVANMAKGMGVPQKPLYVRIQRLLDGLSATLRRDGIGPEYLESLDSGGA
jgi:RNA polymerase sigma factor for flagellar operon FliA